MSETTAGDLTTEHVGMVILGIPGIGGWEDNLLLRDVDQRDGKVYLGFRWNDDPSPQNGQRGQFACGQYVDPSTPVRIVTPPASPDQPAFIDGGPVLDGINGGGAL